MVSTMLRYILDSYRENITFQNGLIDLESILTKIISDNSGNYLCAFVFVISEE